MQKYRSKDRPDSFTKQFVITNGAELRRFIILGFIETSYFPEDREAIGEMPKEVREWINEMAELNERITITAKAEEKPCQSA